jgi:hypothetical protein
MNIDRLCEHLEKNLDLTEFIFEVSPSRSPLLKEIETNFDIIRKSLVSNNESNRRVILKQVTLLRKNIKAFTGINAVYFSIKPDLFNAYVHTKYKNILPKLFSKENVSKFSGIKAEESPKYIEGVYIVFGDKLIKEISPRQSTSILLHEIGHIYQYTSKMSYITPWILKNTSQFAILGTLINPVTIPVALLLFGFARTLTFFDHVGEFKSDEYAVKYGYGDEMAKVMYKFSQYYKKPKESSWLRSTVAFIKNIFSLSTHPEETKRVCAIIDKMKKDYKKKYPKMSKEISTIYADIKC